MQDRSARRAKALFDRIDGTIQIPAYKRLHSSKSQDIVKKHKTCQILQFRVHYQVVDDSYPHQVTFPAHQDHSSALEPTILRHTDLD